MFQGFNRINKEAIRKTTFATRKTPNCHKINLPFISE
jgi:hypothetical protein